MKLSLTGYLVVKVVEKIHILFLDSLHNGKSEVPEELDDGHVRNTVVEPDNKGDEHKEQRYGVGVRDKDTEELQELGC